MNLNENRNELIHSEEVLNSSLSSANLKEILWKVDTNKLKFKLKILS